MNLPVIILGTSKKRFEKGKWVECAESLHQKFHLLTEADGVLYTDKTGTGYQPCKIQDSMQGRN